MTDLTTLGQVPIMGTTRDPLTARLKVELNPDIQGGNQAVTFQPFTELNSKLGTQYEAAFYVPTISASGFVDLVFEVGPSFPVLIKGLQAQFKSDLLQATVYRDPVFTGGVEITVYNLNDAGAVPDDVRLLSGVSVSDTGTQVSPTITTLGSSGTFVSPASSTLSVEGGVERVFEKGTTYLYRITNADTNDSTPLAGLATWYQGPLSTGEIE